MIYLDNAATTPMARSAANKMSAYYYDNYANPSELYSFASKSRKAMNEARKNIASVINAEAEEIYYTSGGTESDNQAIAGTALAMSGKGKKHIITTSIEHHAVTNTCRFLEKHGFNVTYINVDEKGIVDPDDIKNAIRDDTILISVMFANNEIGSIQPVSDIGRIARDYGILFHTDAVQAFAHTHIDVKAMNIDLLSASAHKCFGPKGVGMLYIRSGVNIGSLHFGGKQERGKRPGTENIPGIVGFGEAAALQLSKVSYNEDYVNILSSHFINRIMNEIEDVRLNGDPVKRLPGNVNISFGGIDGEALQIQLDLKNICCSTGSACNAGEHSVSHVISAIKVPQHYAYGTVRFTISDLNTIEELDTTVDALKDAVTFLRSMSVRP